MVGKRSTQSVTQRSTRQSELHMASRPRRLVPPKTLDDTVGLSRKEERELKKALYASLQETRRTRTPQSETEEGSFSQEPPPKLRTSARRSNISASSSVNSFNTTTSSTAAIDESSQDSVMSSAGSTSESKKKIHAQRKFAQGCSLPTTPSTTPNKKASQSPLNLLNRVPKTEDFLTFLCLRGSHVLPPHLDFFSFTRDDTTVEETNSDPCTPISAEKAEKTEEGRESTPESSSTSSNMNDELMEIASYPMPSRILQADRKAARASAGTPETARGIISLQQGMTRKVVHSGTGTPSQHSKKYYFTPEKTPSPCGSRLLLGEFTPAKKSASIKCLPASFFRYSSTGKLVLDRTDSALHLTPYKPSAQALSQSASKAKAVPMGQRQPWPLLSRNEDSSMMQESEHPVFKVPRRASPSILMRQRRSVGRKSVKLQEMMLISNKTEEEMPALGFQKQYLTFLNNRTMCDIKSTLCSENDDAKGETKNTEDPFKDEAAAQRTEVQKRYLLHNRAGCLCGEQAQQCICVRLQTEQDPDNARKTRQNAAAQKVDQIADSEEQDTNNKEQVEQDTCRGDQVEKDTFKGEQADQDTGIEKQGICYAVQAYFSPKKSPHISFSARLHDSFYAQASRTAEIKIAMNIDVSQMEMLDVDLKQTSNLSGNDNVLATRGTTAVSCPVNGRFYTVTTNGQVRGRQEANSWGVRDKLLSNKQSFGKFQVAHEYVSVARTLIVPLPSPPISCWNQSLSEDREALRDEHWDRHNSPQYMQYWQANTHDIAQMNYQGSHYIYRAFKFGCQLGQKVQACMCGKCRFSDPLHDGASVFANAALVPAGGSSFIGKKQSSAFRSDVTTTVEGHFLYPLPPSLMSFPPIVQKSPAGTFKPVKTEQSKEKEARATSVRKTLEGASIKLKKNQKLLSEQKEKKNNLLKLSSRKESIIKQIMSKKRLEKKSEKRDERKERDLLPQKISKSKRRTSLRLKTLAKVLGKKRPNYSLVLSGYADMEEYEEEQKKKAAKFALARAKAEARARASAKARKVKELDKMVTRSSSLTTLKVTGETKRQALSKKQGSSLARKGQDTLANIIESKRVKKETGKETDGQDDVGVKHASEKEGGKKSASSSSPHNKKVSVKKGAPEKVAASVVPPDPTLAGLEEMPTFRPSEEEFSDPISYISSIKEQAEPFGMCRIIPPASWKMESKVNEEIRFTTQIQHLHRLCNRWGPSVEHTTAINHHLRGVVNDHNAIPQIGGVEVDLPQLYRMIRDFGGLQNIVDKKQWVKVADAMKIPKTAHDRVTRLYDIYCKHVLPYAMLTDAEKVQVQKEVSASYEMGSVEEEAILKGKSMTLSAFSRVARNVQSMWFKDDPSAEVVEGAYWKIVKERDTHVAVQCAHVNTRAQSTAFPTRRESPYFRHSWNLNNLPENKKCILKCLGPVSGATIPTLHVGMLFSTSCWSTDPHRLPYVQYLHTGANTIWYCIPKTQVQAFHEAMKELCPTLLHNDPCWLKEDTAMVKPDELMSRGVRVARCVQQQRQFVVVFPDVFTATVCCGYSVSESVHYATLEWLSLCVEAAKALSASKEKELFSVDTLVCGLCQDSSDQETLAASLPLLESIVSREIDERHQLSAAGLKCERRLAVEDSPGNSSSLARKRSHDLTEDSICEVCSKICYLSMVLNEHDEQILCLKHGLRYVQRKRHIKAAKLFYRYTEEELTELVQATKDRLAALTSGASGSSLSKKRALKKQDSKS